MKWGDAFIVEVLEKEPGRINIICQVGKEEHEVSVFFAMGNQIMVVPKTPPGVSPAKAIAELLCSRYPDKKCWVNKTSSYPSKN
jgi:hypothetical protein